MSFNLSELFERVVDAVPGREALVTPARRLTYAELDERANRLAHHLTGTGIGAGDHIGLHLLNGTEYVEAMLAAFKIRAVPVNVNYRYVERELAYLYDNADLAAVVFHRQFSPVVAAVAPEVASIRHLVAVDDDGSDVEAPAGTVAYEEALAGSDPGRGFDGRSGDDLYIAYTGGTTGLPKGVVWRHEDLFFAALGGGDPLLDKGPISDPDELPSRLPGFPMTQLYPPPLMHVSAHWGAFNGFFAGGKVVLASPGRFDPDELWGIVGAEAVNIVTVVGDAMARPFLDHYATHRDTIDASSLFVLASGGAILSPASKAQIAELFPNALVIDAFGSSETGVAGSRSGTSADGRFSVDDRTLVLDDDHRPVVPGSGQIGRVARKGHVPLGYYNDEAKTRATFATVDGERYVLPGDEAMVEADGSVVLLGRGSGCINTGGEKVYPEEVEAVLKAHPDVYDVLVVGAPDERWGQRVVAVVEARPGAVLDPDAVAVHARSGLAGYKVPKDWVVVDRVPRGPNGKPDYARAKELAVST